MNRELLAEDYNVSLKTITRDINELNIYFSGHNEVGCEENITYSRNKNGYILNESCSHWFDSRQILSIVKVLLESRAFNDIEMEDLINKLILNSAPKVRKNIESIINNERFFYTPVSHNKPLLNIIWDLSQALNNQYVVKIKYRKPLDKNIIERKIEPLGIMFSEYYFYLIAHSHKSKDDYNIVYRIDRIIDYEISNEHFKVNYTERFQEGKFRKRVQFMTAGKIIKIKFKFSGLLEAVLDRLPNAEVVEQKDNYYIIKAKVYGLGIKMWLLSQGERLEVMEPKDFRENIKKTINNMAKNYIK